MKKGFTLIEVLVVIAIIGVILLIAIPSISAVKRSINIRLLDSKKEQVLSAAEIYGIDNKIEVITVIHVYDLLSSGYINPDLNSEEGACVGSNTSYGCLINPKDDSILNDLSITITPTAKGVSASYN